MELFKSRTRVAYTNAVGDKVYPVIVDIKKGIKSTEDIQFVSSDVNTGILSVAFISGNENFNVSGADVVCSVMRPDASTLDIPCTIVENNIVEVPLGINGTSQDGIYSFDFKVFKGGNKVVGTPIMNYSVSLSISNDNAVLEDDRLPVLTMLMTQVTELKDEVREAINQANTATEATREATANAIEATTTANETISKVTQDTANAIAEVNATSDTMVENVNNAISNMDITVNDKISEVDTAKNDMINDVSSTKANMVTEVTNAKDEMTATVTNKVNEVEGRFNALTASQQQSSEVIDARDGETSLKARLDRDIEKAKQVYVNIEGSNISTDSSSGYAKDVEILGNTIQDASNLADIRSVGDKVDGQELYEIPVLSCGKNLANPNNFEPSSYITSDGFGNYTIVKTGTGLFIPLLNNLNLKGSTYIIKVETLSGVYTGGNILFYGLDGIKFGEHTANGLNSTATITTTTGLNAIKLYGVNGNATFRIQISENNITEYEPYQEDKLTILSPVQLEKVGDVADRIVCKDGVLGVEKNVKTCTITGSLGENIAYSSTYDRIVFMDLSPRDNTISLSSSGTVTNFTWSSVLRLGIKNISDNGVTSIESARTWLQANPQLVKYIDNQSQFIPLPYDQQVKLRTFANKTNISFLTEIEGTIKAQVPKSLGATVNTHTEQISNLNKELDRVKKLEESTVSTVETESDFTTVEATSNGYFEDVKLEGRTLVNLCTHLYDQKHNSVIDKGSALNYTKHPHYTQCDFKLLQNLKQNTTYTVVLNVTNFVEGMSLQVNFYKYDEWIVCSNTEYVRNKGVHTVLLTTNENIADHIRIGKMNDEVENLDEYTTLSKDIIILEGDHTQNPPNGYIEGLKSVGQSATTSEDGADEIVVSSVNPYGNLFDGELEVGSLNASGDTDWTSYVKTGLIRVKPSSEVICKIGKYKGENATSTDIRMAEYDMNKNFIKFSGGTYKATVSDKTHYVKFAKKLETSDDSRVDINAVSDVVVVYGNKLHDIPHQSDKKRLLYYNEETQTWEKPILRQWDSIEKHANGKYYYHQRSGEVVLNGSESWKKSGYTIEGYSSFYINKPNNFDNNNYICDKFNVMSSANWSNLASEFTCAGTSDINIRLLSTKLSTQDVEGFKQWLQANNVTVVYQLAQEKVYECINIDLITYANETNYIVSSGAIAPKTILKVHNNISNVVKILQEKVSLLESKFIEGLKQVLAGDMYSLAELLYPEDFEEVETENNIMLLPLE